MTQFLNGANLNPLYTSIHRLNYILSEQNLLGNKPFNQKVSVMVKFGLM